jgi:hypothetical protein
MYPPKLGVGLYREYIVVVPSFKTTEILREKLPIFY